MSHLSARERQVADLLLEACSTKEIAQILKISVFTVKRHLCKMYKRYGIFDGYKRVKLAVKIYYEREAE